MFWQLHCESAETPTETPADGRFVLHRHRDHDGPHLDLRLEQDGYLLGWRVDAEALDGAPWATEKAPHPVHWLDRDGEAVRDDAGTYAWLERGAHGGTIELRGGQGVRRLNVRRANALGIAAVRALADAAKELRLDEAALAGAVRDGVWARKRAVERFCALGRELDGTAFNETLWRKTLAELPLEELHTHLHAYEVRFDEKYPPEPVSQPAPLDEDSGTPRSELALDILRA